MSSRRVRFNHEKLRAAARYIISSCPPELLGAVKLHKCLYYSDMMGFVATGDAITGAEYRKRPFGPTCDALLPVLREMERDGEIVVEHVDYHGYRKTQFRPIRLRDSNHLSESDRAILDDVTDFVCRNNTARSISEMSHDMVWDMVEFGDVIQYHHALNLIPNLPSADAEEWGEEEAKKIADFGQASAYEERVAGRTLASIREHMAGILRQRAI